MSQENVELTLRALDAWNRRDVDASRSTGEYEKSARRIAAHRRRCGEVLPVEVGQAARALVRMECNRSFSIKAIERLLPISID